ncbi:PilZ domain-containing protein [Thalassobaculum fulvum]|nr:PilZ domain-containing protein [Thalassobaculum fulvum]
MTARRIATDRDAAIGVLPIRRGKAILRACRNAHRRAPTGAAEARTGREERMSEADETGHPPETGHLPSARLAGVQEALRNLIARTSDLDVAAALAAAAREIGEVRLLLDLPRPGGRRAHMRVPETIGTALMVDDRELDAAIVDISVGGVGLVTDEQLAAGTVLRIAVPPAGWIEAEVVGASGDRLHVRFRSDDADTDQQRALLDLVMRHYE